MKIAVLREELIQTAWAVGAILLGVLLITGYSFYDRQSREDALAQTQRDISLAKNQIRKLEDDNNQFVQMKVRYNQIPESKRAVGLNALPARIALLQPALQDLKIRYRLAVLDISLTNVAPLVTAEPNKRYGASLNTVTLRFGGLSDELLLSFLQELFETLPGYIRVEKLEMKRDAAISPAILGQIRASSTPLVASGAVTFSWKTVSRQ